MREKGNDFLTDNIEYIVSRSVINYVSECETNDHHILYGNVMSAVLDVLRHLWDILI